MAHPRHVGGSIADACRVLLAREHFGDLDLALAFLGVARGTPTLVDAGADLTESSGAQDIDDDVQLAIEEIEAVGTDETDKVGEGEEEVEHAESAPTEFDRLLSSNEAKAYPQVYRETMIAHLLSPDEVDDDRSEVQELESYESVPQRVQHVDQRDPAPDAEVWRVARRAIDDGRKRTHGRRLDVRECTRRAAQRAPLERLPYERLSRNARDLELFVDLALVRGPLGRDIRLLREALRAVVTGTLTDYKFIASGGDWFVGTGPIWTFEPIGSSEVLSSLHDEDTNRVVVTGGVAGTPRNLSPWRRLWRTLDRGGMAAMIWVGDQLDEAFALKHARWIPYRL